MRLFVESTFGFLIGFGPLSESLVVEKALSLSECLLVENVHSFGLLIDPCQKG